MDGIEAGATADQSASEISVLLQTVDGAGSGIDADKLASAAGGDNSILNLINMFAGGAFSRASIMALGIMPYISASIVMQLLGMAVPTFQRLQREGESGLSLIHI